MNIVQRIRQYFRPVPNISPFLVKPPEPEMPITVLFRGKNRVDYLSRKAIRVLHENGIHTVPQLLDLSRADLVAMNGISHKTVQHIMDVRATVYDPRIDSPYCVRLV